jgi:hypothetical protein
MRFWAIAYPSANAGKIAQATPSRPLRTTATAYHGWREIRLYSAQSIYNEMVKNEMRLSADLPGHSILHIMHVIPVTSIGTAFDQTYYPESIQRTLSNDEGFRMKVSAKNHSDEVEPVGVDGDDGD